MAAYAVTDFSTDPDSMVAVLAALEVKLDTIDDAKTIHLIQCIPTPDRKFVGVIIYDA